MNTQQTIVIEYRSNGLGVAGFVVSLLGWVMCGILCPIGFVLSLIGVCFRPRGLAVAGLLIGGAGSLFLWFVGMALVLGFLGVSKAVNEAARVAGETSQKISMVSESEAEKAKAGESQSQLEAAVPKAKESQAAEELEAKKPHAEKQEADAPEAKVTTQVEPELEWHTFTDNSGQFRVEAQLVGVLGGAVSLKKRDGSQITVQRDRLSEQDQVWIRDQIKKRSQ